MVRNHVVFSQIQKGKKCTIVLVFSGKMCVIVLRPVASCSRSKSNLPFIAFGLNSRMLLRIMSMIPFNQSVITGETEITYYVMYILGYCSAYTKL